MIVVFDIDHVVADSRHRDHHIKPSDGSAKNWPAYYEALPDDPVILPIYNIIADLGNAGRHKLYLCTGRHEEKREETRQWFTDNGLWRYFKEMRMRPLHMSDWSNASIKETMAKDFDHIDLVFEDNPLSVAMWQKYAKLVCEVKYGQA